MGGGEAPRGGQEEEAAHQERRQPQQQRHRKAGCEEIWRRARSVHSGGEQADDAKAKEGVLAVDDVPESKGLARS